MNPTRLSLPLTILLTALGLMACGGTTAERVSLPVRVVGLGGDVARKPLFQLF